MSAFGNGKIFWTSKYAFFFNLIVGAIIGFTIGTVIDVNGINYLSLLLTGISALLSYVTEPYWYRWRAKKQAEHFER